MSTSDQRVVIEFLSRPENVAFARTTAAVFASRLNFTVDELDEIKIAVSEAVSNAIVHGYEGGIGSVRLVLDVIRNNLILQIKDEGVGISDIEWARQPTHTTQPDDRMGLGLVFIYETMNEVSIESKPGRGTVIHMVKKPATPSVYPAEDPPTRDTSLHH